MKKIFAHSNTSHASNVRVLDICFSIADCWTCMSMSNACYADLLRCTAIKRSFRFFNRNELLRLHEILFSFPSFCRRSCDYLLAFQLIHLFHLCFFSFSVYVSLFTPHSSNFEYTSTVCSKFYAFSSFRYFSAKFYWRFIVYFVWR